MSIAKNSPNFLWNILNDAFDNGILFDKLIISEAAFLKYPDDIEKLSSDADECYKIPDSLFKKISDTASPQGIIAIAKIPDSSKETIDKKGR